MALENAWLMAVRGLPEDWVDEAVDMDGEYTHARAVSRDFPSKQVIQATTKTAKVIIICTPWPRRQPNQPVFLTRSIDVEIFPIALVYCWARWVWMAMIVASS